MLLIIGTMLFSAGKLDPGIKNRLIMTDEAGMPLDDGYYNVTFRVYDCNRDGSVLAEKTANVESKNGVCQIYEGLLTDYVHKGYKEVWISLQIENQPENKFRTRIFLEPIK
jgi:hypothetical protein